MEKFVQIPFQVPKPSAAEIGDYIAAIMDGTSDRPGESRRRRDQPVDDDTLDPDYITRIGKLVAPAFEYNPRLVNTFVNLFRLRTMLATELNLFGSSDGVESGLTPEQLGKVVAISIRWPSLLTQLDEPTLVALHDAAIEIDWAANAATIERAVAAAELPAPVASWSRQNQTRLLELLVATDDEEDWDLQAYYLTEIDVQELLQISPSMAQPALPPESALSAK